MKYVSFFFKTLVYDRFLGNNKSKCTLVKQYQMLLLISRICFDSSIQSWHIADLNIGNYFWHTENSSQACSLYRKKLSDSSKKVHVNGLD